MPYRTMSGTVGIALRGTVSTIVGLALAGVMAWQSGSTPTAPVNTALPAITGTPQVGQALTAFDGTFSGTAPITIARRWQYSADGSTGWTTISASTGATYTPAAARQGQYIRVQVRASNAAGSSAWISSAAVGPVAAAAGATGLLSGTTWPSQPQAQPTNLIPSNARLFATSAPYIATVPSGVTFGSIGAIFDGTTTASTTFDITLPTALVTGRRYGLLFGMPERTAGTVSVSLMPGSVAPEGASFTAARNFTRAFVATQAHTSVRITIGAGANLRMNYISLVDMTSLLAKKWRVVFLFDTQSNAVGNESSDVDWSIDRPELRAVYIPGVANSPFGATLDANSVGKPLIVQDPLQHSTTNAGGGPMGSFVKRMTDSLRDDEILVLIATGWAGQGRLNSGYWNRDGADFRAWTNMLTQLRGTLAQAPTGSTTAGALQCGHEADVSVNSATLLPAAVERDIADLRAEFGNFPVVMMEIGIAAPSANQIGQQDAMEALAGRLARCAYIRRPAGATFRPDGVHYDQATNRIRGAAAADKLLEINYGAPKPSTGTAPQNTSAPIVTGTLTIGGTVGHSGDTWTGTEPFTATFQWQRSVAGGAWADIAGAVNGTYTLVSADGGNRIRLIKIVGNSAGSASVTTAPVNIASAGGGDAFPVLTTAPTIAGGAAVGDAFTHSGDVWAGGTPMTSTFQWQRSVGSDPWINISGATSGTYARTAADNGNRVRLIKIATNASGSATAASNAISVGAGSTIAGTLTNPPVSMVLSRMDEPGAAPFTNQFKSSEGWRNNGDLNQYWDSVLAAGHIDAKGRVLSVPSGGLINFCLSNQLANATGRYRLRWTGAGDVWVNGGSNVTTVSANEIQFDYTGNGQNQVAVIVNSLTTGPLANWSLVHQDDWPAFDAGQKFRAAFLTEVRNYRCLRFDEWAGIQLTPEMGGTRVTTWASRAQPDDEVFQRFVPYEWMIELCNVVGADPWICFQVAVDLNHFAQAATLFNQLIQAPRQLYVELATKIWDPAGGTAPFHWLSAQGFAAFGTTGQPQTYEMENFYAMRTVQMAQAFRAVWGASNSRLNVVIQGQADNSDLSVEYLQATMWRDRAGTAGFPNLPAYVAPHSIVDMITVHGQLDGGFGYAGWNGPNDPKMTMLTDWRTNLTREEAFNRIRDQILTHAYHNDTQWGQRTLVELVAKLDTWRSIADGYGLKLGCYQFGNHLNDVDGTNTVTVNQAFLGAFSWSSQMGEVYSQAFAAMRTRFNGPICFATLAQQPGITVRGLQRQLGDHNPAWTAMNTINQANNGPAGRGASDFVGTMEVST